MTTSNESSFASDVKAAFNFLVEKQGYSVDVDAENGVVIFANESFEFRVFREPGSYMIYVEIRRNDTGEEYLLHEILNALAPDDEPNAQCSGADEAKTSCCLSQLSQLCRQHLQRFLAMDKATLEKVALSAKLMRTRYTLDAQYGAVKDRANQAWEQKDWEKARELYEEAKPGLSMAEERRLEFLSKKNR